MVKWSWRNEGFEGKKRRGRRKVLNKAAKMVLKKARYKIGDSTRKLSHSRQARSRKVHEKLLEVFEREAQEMAKKKNLLSLPSKAHLVSNLWRSSKALLCKGAGMIIFFGWMPGVNFFQLPKQIFFLKVELAPAHQVIKMLEMDHLWVYTLYPTQVMLQRLQCVIKNQKGHTSYWNSEYMYSIAYM